LLHERTEVGDNIVGIQCGIS